MKSVLSDRMKMFLPSPIRAMFELGQRMKNPIDLSVGQPDFDTPNEICEAASRAMREGKNRYSVTAGVPEFRELVKRSLESEGFRVEDAMIVAGASGGLLLSLFALVDRVTDVYILDPYFVSYKPLIHLVGGRVCVIDTSPDFKLTPERLKSVVKGKNKKVLLFNSPVNPTGLMYTEDEIRALAKITRRLGIQVISDEAYDRFAYDFPHCSWLRYDPGAVLVRTLGKTWSMTGWRVGYVAGPRRILEAMAVLQQFTFVCVNTPAQWGGVTALGTDTSELIASYRRKRDYLCSELQPVFELPKPQGAFYAFVKIPGSTKKFFLKCIEKELLVTPGHAFSERGGYFRISFATSDEKLERGLSLLRKIEKEM